MTRLQRWLTLLGLILASGLAWSDTYAINTGFKPPVSDIYRKVITEAFTRIGAQVDFREISAERSITLANDGVDDGDCCRVVEIDRFYPNLVRVPVMVLQVDFVAFVKDSSGIELRDWSSLAPYEVGVVSGWKLLEKGLADHPPRQLYTLDTPESLFGMLRRDRIQVATIGRLVGYKKLRDMEMRGIRVAEPPLASRPLYLFLHQKHQVLVPQLEAALAAMDKDGTLKRYHDEVVAPLMNGNPAPAARSGTTP